jgi:hypothetical protein
MDLENVIIAMELDTLEKENVVLVVELENVLHVAVQEYIRVLLYHGQSIKN